MLFLGKPGFSTWSVVILLALLTGFTGACAKVSSNDATVCLILKSTCFPESLPGITSNWKFTRKLSFDNSGLSTALDNAPVLIKLDASRIDYDSAGSAGEALIFLDADGVTSLPFEIESWNTVGDSYIWVKVPQISDSSQTDFIFLNYGNPDAVSSQTPTQVWNDNFKSVWHFSQTGAATDRLDSSGNGFTVSPNNFDGDEDVTGMVGPGLLLDGTNDYLDLPLEPGPLTQFTIEAFVQRNSINNWDSLIDADSWAASYAHIQFSTDNSFEMAVNGNNPGNANSSFTVTNDAAWHYIVAVYDSTAKTTTFYLDGVQANTVSYTTALAVTLPTSRLGSWNGGGREFNGNLDEIRISNTARSSEWVETQYKSMTDAFVSFGSQVEN